jgi:tyrosine-protein kinase Etk/Wzc
VRVVDHAAVGFSPVRPRKQRILMISLVLGALLGTVAVFGREMLRRGMTDPDSLEQNLGFPVYAVVPHSRAQKRSEKQAKRKDTPIGLLARDLPTDGAVESLRSLRTALSFALMDAERNVVVITSPGPASGKTFLSVNLAWVLGQNKQKVLLMDGDLRRGHVNAYLDDRRRTPGLSEVLSGQSWLEDAVVPLVPGLVDVMPSGEFPPNPSELLMRPEFGALLKKLRSLYDVVLIDTPPVLAATDGVIIARHAGPLFMAVRAGQTTERETRAALRRLEQVEIKVTGLLFNDLEAKSSRYGYGAYEHYTYSYAKKRGKSAQG